MTSVLLLEDSQTTRTFLSRQLAADGASVSPFESVADARAFLARERVDAAILDVHLPDGLGAELLPLLQGVPVLFVTSAPDEAPAGYKVLYKGSGWVREVSRFVAGAKGEARVGDVLFFGCHTGRVGHYLWRVRAGRYEMTTHKGLLPWENVDGALCPGADHNGYAESYRQVEGAARLHHLDGWTALAWWDRSGDTRRGSNAALFARGTLTADEMLALGRRHFPGLLERMAYRVRLDG